MLCIDNAGSIDEIVARLISCLCYLSVLQSHIINSDKDNSDNETEINVENNSSVKNISNSKIKYLNTEIRG